MTSKRAVFENVTSAQAAGGSVSQPKAGSNPARIRTSGRGSSVPYQA